VPLKEILPFMLKVNAGAYSFARLVGRENVIAGSDCGFSSRATYGDDAALTVSLAQSP